MNDAGDIKKGTALQEEATRQDAGGGPIPSALQDPSFRFILLRQGQKTPIEAGWQKDPSSQYTAGSPSLLNHIAGGGNYGVVTGPGRLCVFDVDDPEWFKTNGILERFRGTFTVSTGKGVHFYFRSDFTGKRILTDPEDQARQLGDIRGGPGFQVVAPGSLHPSGRRYSVVNASPLIEISADELHTIADQVTPRKPQAMPDQGTRKRKTQGTGRGTITDDLNLQVTDFLMPTKAIKQGDELIGTHPTHGSTSGNNLHVNTAKNSWHCFRCNSGGGPLEAFAVSEGIISCDEAQGRCLRDKWPEVFNDLEKRGYRIPPRRMMQRPQAPTAEADTTPSQNAPDQDLPMVPPPGQWSGTFCDFDTSGNVSRLNFAAIGDYIRSRHVIVPFNGENFVYDPATGIYRKNAGELEKEIQGIARHVGYKGSVTRATKEILFYAVYSGTPIREYPFNRCTDLIPVRNGVVKLDFITGSITLLPHSPEHMITFVLPVDYDPEADQEEIERLLNEWVAAEDVPILYQIPAQALYQMQADKSFKRSYILQGDFNAGKSTYLNFLKDFLGEENICHVSLQDITGGDRFASSRLENKILNAYDDLPDQDLQNIGRFKNLTGSTHHAIERKHANGYDGRIFATHVFSCNRPPNVPNDVIYDVAFWERWIYVVFPYAFDTDPTFEEKHFTDRNKSAFLNRVLTRLIEIRQSKALTVNFEANEVMDRWTRQADPLYLFIEEKFQLIEGGQNDFDKDRLFEEYQKYFDEEGINEKLRIKSLNQFTRDLVKYKLTAFKTSTKRDGKKFPIYSYRGPYEWKNPATRESMKASIKDLYSYKD